MDLEINPAAHLETRPATPAPVRRTEHAESSLTRLLEQQAAKIPSDVFLFGGLGAMITSLGLELADHPRASRFVGMWAPTLLIMGVYNKIVKLGGTR